jgi:hypothetical protein
MYTMCMHAYLVLVLGEMLASTTLSLDIFGSYEIASPIAFPAHVILVVRLLLYSELLE